MICLEVSIRFKVYGRFVSPKGGELFTARPGIGSASGEDNLSAGFCYQTQQGEGASKEELQVEEPSTRVDNPNNIHKAHIDCLKDEGSGFILWRVGGCGGVG